MFLLRLLLIPRSPETLTHVHTVPLLLGSTTTQRSVRRNSVWQRPLWIWPSKLGACLPSGQKPAQEAFRTPPMPPFRGALASLVMLAFRLERANEQME
jgi:hypothetical protein